MINNIYCIGRNYTEHAKELGNLTEEEPIIFSKPNTSVIKNNTIELPSFSKEIHYETELVIKISKNCYKISKDEAKNYFNEIAIGLDLTARDLQSKLKSKGLPWLLSKGFKGSCFVSKFIEKPKDLANVSFSMNLNNELKQMTKVKEMVFSVDYIISYLSNFIELTTNDIIFTGTPKGVGKLNKNDQINLFINNELISEVDVE